MANKDVEIELKFPLNNAEEVVAFLNEKANLKSKDVFQRDTYFTPKHRDFLSVKYPFEWLRLRKTSKGSYLNYKHFFPENVEKNDYCDEFETKIDNIEAVKKMFISLNFKEAVVVEKTRTAWIFENVEIVIDNIKGLGTFIELEAIENFDDPKNGKEYLYKVLEKLNAHVGKEDNRGYPYLILEKQGHKFNH